MTDIVEQAARRLYEAGAPYADSKYWAQKLAEAGLLADGGDTSILEEFVVPCPRCNPVEGRCLFCRREADAYYRAAINAISTYSAAKELSHDGDSDAGGYVGRDLRALAERIKQHLLQHPEQPARTVPTREQIAEAMHARDDEDVDYLDHESALRYADAILALIADQPTVAEAKAQALADAAHDDVNTDFDHHLLNWQVTEDGMLYHLACACGIRVETLPQWTTHVAAEAKAQALEEAAENINLHKHIPEDDDRITWDMCLDDDCIWWEMAYALQDEIKARAHQIRDGK